LEIARQGTAARMLQPQGKKKQMTKGRARNTKTGEKKNVLAEGKKKEVIQTFTG